jgi:hypothetical protein
MQWNQEDELGSWFVLDKFRRFLDKKLGNFGGKCLLFYFTMLIFWKTICKFFHNTFFNLQFCDAPKENLAKFGYKPDMKVFWKPWIFLYILVWTPCLMHRCVFGPFGLILIWDPPGLGMPFLDNDTCAEEGGGGLFISARVFFPVWCHPWMDDRTNGWMDGSRDEKSFTKNDHDVLYYM